MVLIVGGKHQGKERYAKENYPDGEHVFDLHERIHEVLSSGGGYEDLIEEIMLKENIVITCDEVGSGIVPADRFQRNYREAVGNACMLIAKRAETVIRVCAGVGIKLK
ncbi:MAG: bifunctional adenosylcobinamide kinase/adenosylcobinamide-phosphate guanylyltransferase [Eubacterium sp.]|nr:bifunctional adenosylcobinamide kinase/adenosylcobinamide-phosphate guanylyltransferase [Eubacterium sp.]